MVKLGRDLKVGDVIRVWWSPGRDTVCSLTPYRGRLAHLWSAAGGAQIARMALLPSKEMTIEPATCYEVEEED